VSNDATRPNILWICCEDISADLSCYAGVWPGAEYAQTPNLDQLAADGARFDNAFAVAPVCAPSRSGIITGMYPTAIGTMHMRSRAVPPPEVRCLPEYLRAAGYYCTNSSKTEYQFRAPVTLWDENGRAAHWRNRPDPEQPFFAVFNSLLTHESQIYVGDEQHMANTAALTPEQRHDPAAAPLPPYYPDTPSFRQAWAQYSDNISAMDHWAGELLHQLDEDGVADNTLVVFWSDHGRGFPRAKRWPYEAGLHEPLLVRWPGKIASGNIHTGLVSLIDLAPTMLAAAGLSVPPHMHGRPIFDSQGQPASEPREVVFGHRDRMDETEDRMRTVRDRRFRYIRNDFPDRPYWPHLDYAEPFSTWRELRTLHFQEATIRGRGETPNLLTPAQRLFLSSSRPPEELYDLASDPHEITNLAGDPAYTEVLERLRGELATWQSTYGDLGLVPEAELIERWRPGGTYQVTERPVLRRGQGAISATCPTEGASIAWTADPPAAPESASEKPTQEQMVGAIFGDPDFSGRRWHLYTEPVTAKPGQTLWFRACRLGFQDSVDVESVA
jgi:N-sulfoglucosamine sulfohydrolase